MDIKVIETGNGGDLLQNGNDLAMVYSFENMPYLAMFGGNKSVTPSKRLPSEQVFDFWANNLLWPNDADIQFNSTTEKMLEETPLTSSGRIIIEEAVKTDLAFMSAFSDVSVYTEIMATDKIKIGIILKKPENLEEKKYVYIWENGNITTE